MNNKSEKASAPAVVSEGKKGTVGLDNSPKNDKAEEEKPSVGEELWQVHLLRHKGEPPSEEDYDCEGPRKRSRSVGEELWEVHIKRSQGFPLDVDAEEAPTVNKKKERAPATRETKKSKATERCSDDGIHRVLHLRTRDVVS